MLYLNPAKRNALQMKDLNSLINERDYMEWKGIWMFTNMP